MSDLKGLPNISKVLEETLLMVGIDSQEKLFQDGSKGAFAKIRIAKPDSCINMLYALEGAVQNIRWHQLDRNIKAELKDFYDCITFKPVKNVQEIDF